MSLLQLLDKKPMYDGEIGIEKLHSQMNVHLIYYSGSFVGNIQNKEFKPIKDLDQDKTDFILNHLRNYQLVK